MHGFLYMIFLVVAADLARRARFPFGSRWSRWCSGRSRSSASWASTTRPSEYGRRTPSWRRPARPPASRSDRTVDRRSEPCRKPPLTDAGHGPAQEAQPRRDRRAPPGRAADLGGHLVPRRGRRPGARQHGRRSKAQRVHAQRSAGQPHRARGGRLVHAHLGPGPDHRMARRPRPRGHRPALTALRRRTLRQPNQPSDQRADRDRLLARLGQPEVRRADELRRRRSVRRSTGRAG